MPKKEVWPKKERWQKKRDGEKKREVAENGFQNSDNTE